jgi:hypothetical protein
MTFCGYSRFSDRQGNNMLQNISDDDALLLAQILRSFNLDETTSAARFIESLTFDAIFLEEWESVCGSQPQLRFYGRLADAILDGLANHSDVDNSVREKATQLLAEIEAHYEWLSNYMNTSRAVDARPRMEFLPY